MPADDHTEAERHLAAAGWLDVAVFAIGRAIAHVEGLDTEDVLRQIQEDVRHLKDRLGHCGSAYFP